jgi:hypothetical protein
VGVCKGYDSIGVRESNVVDGVPAMGKIEKAGRAHGGNYKQKIP